MTIAVVCGGPSQLHARCLRLGRVGETSVQSHSPRQSDLFHLIEDLAGQEQGDDLGLWGRGKGGGGLSRWGESNCVVRSREMIIGTSRLYSTIYSDLVRYAPPPTQPPNPPSPPPSPSPSPMTLSRLQLRPVLSYERDVEERYIGVEGEEHEQPRGHGVGEGSVSAVHLPVSKAGRGPDVRGLRLEMGYKS